ncbi:MAG: PIN domain-containing protein [archaeon]
MSVFLDTSYVIALANKSEAMHERAMQTAELIKKGEFGSIFTSSYVFDEAVTFTLTRQGHTKALALGTSILNSEITLIHISQWHFEKAWQLFAEGKELSFTDCTSIAAMQENGIKNIATFDKGFTQFKGINPIG